MTTETNDSQTQQDRSFRDELGEVAHEVADGFVEAVDTVVTGAERVGRVLRRLPGVISSLWNEESPASTSTSATDTQQPIV